MPTYPAWLIALIDSRIDQSLVKPTKMGTVQDRATATALAVVAFDGSSGIGSPVKCFENVVVDVGDRVGLAKVEGEWVIIGNYTPREWADIMIGVDTTSGGTTTSASFSDMPTSPRANFVKCRDVTQFQIHLDASVFTATATAVVEFAANITFPDGTQMDQVLYHRAINAVSDHRDMSGGITTPGLTLPGGGYAVVARWRRVSGSGTLTMDANDGVTLSVKEVMP